MSFSTFSTRSARPSIVEPHFHLGKIEVERALLESSPTQHARQFPRDFHALAQRGRDLQRHGLRSEVHLAAALVVRRRRHGLIFENGESLPVSQPRRAVDHGLGKLRGPDLARLVELDESRGGEPIHPRLQRAHAVAQPLRQHRDDAVGEVGRVAARARLAVERIAGPHVVRDVRDVDAEPPAGFGALDEDRVVEILRVVRIDRDHHLRPAILAPRDFLRVDRFRNLLRLAQHVGGKFQRQLVFADDREHVHAGCAGWAEHLDDLALGVGLFFLPRLQLDDHLVADARRLGRRHVDVVPQTGIIGQRRRRTFSCSAACRRLSRSRAPKCG